MRFNAIFRPENSFFFFFFTQYTPMYLGKYLHWRNLASRRLDYTISFGLPLTVAVCLCRRRTNLISQRGDRSEDRSG